MKSTPQPDCAWFTTRGQIVIPARLRREYQIEDGTKVVLQSTPEGILLRPVTQHAIERLHGLIKRKPGGKTFAEEWAEHKREERALEDADDALHGP